MASFIINGFQPATQTLIDGEGGYIGQLGQLVVSSGDGITGSGINQLIVHGNLTTFIGGEEAYDFDGSAVDVHVGQTGSINSASSNALDLVAISRIEVINSGSITSDAIAVRATTTASGNVIVVQNHGIIAGETGLSLTTPAVFSDFFITNTGVISAEAFGVRVESDGETTLINSGTITSTSGKAIQTEDGNDVILNTGTIVGNVTLIGGNDYFDNTDGVITQPERFRIDLGNGSDTFLGGAGAERIRDGNDNDLVETNGGNDTIVSSAGNDTYNGGSGSDLLDMSNAAAALEVDLGLGFVAGGSFGNKDLISIERVRTGDGNDTVTGSADDDIIRLGFGTDVAHGLDGNDRIDGQDLNDTLNGGDGNDLLLGGAEDDRLSGDNGNDRLIGGAGRDFLTGGNGNDRFIFLDIGDSGITGAARDLIRDFQQGNDKIDVRAIDAVLSSAGDDAFAFIGTTAFSNTSGELRFRQTATLTLVDLDQDGDGISDMSIRLDGVINLTADDFVL